MTFGQELTDVKKVLRENPRGLTVSDIAKRINVNRNSVAKYLDVLLVMGGVEMHAVGPAKMYFLSHRVPSNALLNFSNDFIFILDQHLSVVQVNDMVQELCQVNKERIIGQKVADCHMLQSFKIPAQHALKGVTKQMDICVDLHGKKRCFITKMIPTTFDDGSPGVTIIAEDATERIESEERLRILTRAMDSCSCGVSIADMTQEDQPLIYVNPAFEKLTGYKSEEVVGKNCRFLQGRSPDKSVQASIRKALTEGRTGEFLIKNYRKDGSSFWNELNLSPVKDEEGDVTHYIGIQTNVSWRVDKE